MSSADLVAFLRARLYDDERRARALVLDGKPVENPAPRHVLPRVLAEIDRKRDLVSRYEAMAADVLVVTGREAIISEYRRVILPDLALPYAAHPDYQDEWRP
ncbi:DUF6221 family protein [Streptomyces sp. NBC_01102]|uniref:DUF6221 family protein n=1 Tax=Streptomyces sp. NBC_01102 TaxID=2903749 RepID=UPI00386F7C8F|nr:DUF6221 family protein [Streptomyces sp. NBC_01102]